MKTPWERYRFFAFLTVLAILVLFAWGNWALSAEDAGPTVDKQTQARRRPKVYLSIFNNGYSGDPMPQEPERFEKLLKVITEQGNFNAVLCKYRPERETLCKKYGVLMVVDLLAEGQHVFQNPREAEELCTRLRDNPTVVAYHLWSDRFGKTGAGRARDIENVHRWDPTHATISGTYQSEGIHHLAAADFISYYDFAWKRGTHKNFPNLLAAWKAAKLQDQRLARTVETDGGLAGKGNFNRSLYTQNTSIACGLRAVFWFIGSRIMDMKSLELNELGKDAARVNAWTRPLWSEIAKLGLPTAIYATPITRDPNNREISPGADGKRTMPPGLENFAFPKDFWLQPVAGEFVLGLSTYEGQGQATYLANLNAYAEQNVELKISTPVKPRIFNRQRGRFEELPLQNGTVRFQLEPAGGELVVWQ